MIEVLALALYGDRAASTRYRLEQYIPRLRDDGIHLRVAPLLGNEYIKSTFARKKYGAIKLVNHYMARAVTLARRRDYDIVVI